MWPSILPDRKAVLFVNSSTFSPLNDGQLSVLDLETGQVTELGIAGTYPHYVSTGHLVYAAADGSVRAAPFNVNSLQVTGNPVPLVEGISVKIGGAANFSISDTGRLVYSLSSGACDVSVVWADREGREEPLEALDPGRYASLRLSPDGARLAFDFGNRRLWTYDIARGVRNPLTTETGPGDRNPVWTPDGARIVFSRANGLFWTSADGTGEPEELLIREGASQLIPESWSPEGDFLFSSVGGGRGPTAIEVLSMDSERATEVLIDTDQTEGSTIVSPDGRWMAYHSNVSGRFRISAPR